MLTYLLLSGPGVTARDAAGLDARVRASAPEVLLQAAEATLWTDDTGHSLLWTWESATEKFGGSHVHVTDRDVLALAGSAWSRTSWMTAGSLAAVDALRADPASMRAGLTGKLLGGLDRRPTGDGFVTTDDTGTGHVYLARDTDVWAVSNRAPLAALGLHGRWEPDVESQAWMAMLGMFAGGDTSVRGVELLPASSAVRLVPGRLPALEVGETPWETGAFSSITASAGTRRRGARAGPAGDGHRVDHRGHTGRPPVRRQGLATGPRGLPRGRDAPATSGSARWGCPARPTERSPCSSARRTTWTSRSWSLRRTTGPRSPSSTSSSAATSFQTAGMFGAWDLKGGYVDSTEIKLTGLFGELMRTIYRLDQPSDTPEQGIDHLLNKMAWDRQGLLRPDGARAPGPRSSRRGRRPSWRGAGPRATCSTCSTPRSGSRAGWAARRRPTP